MDLDRRYIARQIFVSKVYQSEGKVFEDLFKNIMVIHDNNFEPIKPHGNYGDRKNDGFNKISGTYYQVYAPEDIRKKYTQVDAIKKAEIDFIKLIQNWDKVYKIRDYKFVINDKYKGVYPKVHKVLEKIGSQHSITSGTWLTKDLEQVFLEFDEEKMMRIIGLIPSSSTIDIVNFSTLTDVINYLIKNSQPYKYDGSLANPKFENKITFNNLGSFPAHLLNIGNYQASAIDSFFSKNSDDVKQQLSKIFNDYYIDAEKIIPESIEKSDLEFFYILNKACPEISKSVQDAVIVLMSYYFESCDIFKEPK